MPPVGNDVVDLTDPENVGKSRDRRFCNRVFNGEERARIAASLEPDRVLWAFWAAKEAAYKAISRANPSICSIPRRYPVFWEESAPETGLVFWKGTVKTPVGEVFVRIQMENAFLHALAARTAEELTEILARVEAVSEGSDDPSAFAREILLREVARRTGSPLAELSVLKEEQRPWAPYITRGGVRLLSEISLSHDGKFAAFAVNLHP